MWNIGVILITTRLNDYLYALLKKILKTSFMNFVYRNKQVLNECWRYDQFLNNTIINHNYEISHAFHPHNCIHACAHVRSFTPRHARRQADTRSDVARTHARMHKYTLCKLYLKNILLFRPSSVSKCCCSLSRVYRRPFCLQTVIYRKWKQRQASWGGG